MHKYLLSPCATRTPPPHAWLHPVNVTTVTLFELGIANRLPSSSAVVVTILALLALLGARSPGQSSSFSPASQTGRVGFAYALFCCSSMRGAAAGYSIGTSTPGNYL